MAEELKQGVEEPVAPTVEVQPEQEVEVSEDVKTPTVDRKVYENVREDMKKERAERKAKEVKIAELEARLSEVELQREVPEPYEEDGDVRTRAKVDILYLVQSDSFVKENLDLIEEKMADNPKLSAKEAIKEIKSDFFDRMRKEVSSSEPEVLPKQIKPKGNNTIRTNIIQDALDGKYNDVDPAQLEAYKAQLARLGK
jgi:hypothetical protein